MAFCTHTHKNFWTQPSLRNLSHSGTLRASSNRAHFSTSIGPVTVSHFCSMCCTHNHKASSTSSHVTIWARFEDSADGVDASLVSSYSCPFLVKWRESIPWVKRRALSGRFLKWLTVSAWETSWLLSYQFLTCSQSWRVRLFLCEGVFENVDVFGAFFTLFDFPVFGPGIWA